MQLTHYLPERFGSLLDVGCNVGAWLRHASELYPGVHLAGVEINADAVAVARANVPAADLRHAGADELPFADASFDCATCVEVLEHVPPARRAAALAEIRRVLRPGGRLVLTVPHAGWFAWLDSNNLRHRLPGLYRRLIGRGRRDANYDAAGLHVEWHHHFTLAELRALAGDGWRLVAVRRGALFVAPLIDLASWPFYRLNAAGHPVRRLLERLAGAETRIDFGRASYRVLVAWERVDGPPPAA